MTPMLSPLLALQKAIAKAKGAYGAQRVEKAADLVPNLEKMYQMEALERAFGGDNAKALIVMPPERFEDFAKPIFVGDPVHRKMMEDNVKSLQKLRQGFADVPFLEVGHKPGQLPFISGHEGRHRSRALQKRGEESSLVNVFPKYREDFPRRTQEEFIEEMRRQLGESRLVTPEGKLRATPENPEGAIEFPEIFREGGAVHMKDGSTDKVRQLIEEAKGSSGRYDPMRAQRVSEYEKGFRDFLAAQQEARESLFKPSPTVGGMAKGAAGALAGYAAQVPGIVGDVLSLYDEFKPERAPNLPEWARAIPTTERLQEYYLPENASPELQAGVTGGNLFALGQGLAALPKVVAGGARMAGKGAQALAPKAAEMTEEYLLRSGLMPQVFIGPSAKTWNPRAAFKASQMERAGKSPEEIWAATKTFKGADGNWRQEISDQSARFLTEADLKAKAAAMYEQERVNRLAIAQSKLHPDLFPKQLTAAQKDLRAQSKALREERTALHGPETNPMWRGNFAKYALEHPELYEAYPELADIIVKQGIPYSPYKAVLNQSAPLKAGDPVSSHISMEITEKGLRDDPRSSALHEMQHAIQGIEGWAPGGNMVTAFLNPKAHDILNSLRQTAMTPMSFEDYAKRFSHVKDLNKGYEAYKASIPSIVKNMDRELQTTAAEQYYRRLAGEAEARATQARRNMSAAERAQVAPGESYDVPINEQIVNPPSYAEGGTVSKDAMRMKSWDKHIQRKAKGGEVTQAEIDAASKPYRMPAPKRRGSIDASGAKAAGTLLSGIASAVPAGYAGLLELARTRDPKMAADAVEALQERYMSMPEDERTAEKIERLSGALETLGEPARLVGETTLRATGSPLAATIAELGLDPMNYLPLIGKAPAAARAAKKAAQNLGPVADQMLENYMLKTGQMLPLNVYHGSPHRFAPTPKNPLGEFDPTKIGTGEGAQAYGYGHYLAEAPGVAKTYQPRSPEYEQKLLEKYNRAQAKRDYTTMEILEDAMLHRSPDEIIQRFTNAEDGYTPAHAKAARDFVNWYAKNPPEVGGLYKVDLPDEQIAKMLDWDKPLSEQPESVRNAINSIVEAEELYKGKYAPRFLDKRTTAGEAVNIFGDALGGSDVAANYLREAGIPGIRYLDQASRGAGEGTRNFVVFPGGESMLNIISREKKGGMVSEDAMRMKAWDKQIQRKAGGGAVKKMSGGSLVRAGTKAASAAKALTSAGKSADEMAEVRKVAPEGQQNVQEILEPKSNVGKGAGKASDLVTDLRAAPKVGVASPLATRSAADKAEEALQKTQAFKSLKGQDRQRAIDSVRAKAERSGIPRTKADLNAAMAGEEDIARSMLNSPAYKIANVVPRATVNKALETRQMYRAEPPTTPGPNASEKEWADWGASHGVNMTVTTPESLGISDLMSRREAMIPGGLKGTFTIPDLFWIKANNFNPAALPQDVHTELMKKFIRTFKINSPDEVDVFNRLNFALLSPNAPLTPNEFLAQRARLRTPEELSALAGRVGEEGLNRTAAAQLGVGQAGSGGMGVLGTADLSSQAMLAKLIKDKPSMFQMAPGETMRDVTMRVMNQAPGLGPKTASLGTPWLDLEKANTSAVDLHMIRDAYPMLLHDPIVGKAFRERMAGLLKTKPTAAAILSKPEKDVRDAAIAIVGGTDMSRLYRLKSGELNRIPDVATPDKLAYEPKSFSEFNPFYSRVVDYVDQSRGANPDIELFPEQWRKWDVLRQRIEPHEFAHPDYRKLPRQSFSEMQNALTAHKEAGYTQSNNPTMNLSDWRKLYYGRAVPEILAPTAAAGAAAAAAQTLLSDDSEKARGGAVHMAEGGLTSDDLILEERKL